MGGWVCGWLSHSCLWRQVFQMFALHMNSRNEFLFISKMLSPLVTRSRLGSPRGTYRALWNPMGSHGGPWTSMWAHRAPWASMEPHEASFTILRVMTLFISASHNIEDKIIHIM